ncbi:MAG: type III-B CRISPR module RAMP protein Cmr1 [Thermoproteota archaeon]
MTLQRLSFTLETVTPLFLSGNNQNEVELRAPSIRGQLRHWYRALLGGLGVTQSTELYKFESIVFGKEERGSPLMVRVKDIRLAGGRIKQNKELDLGYDRTKKEARRPGITYLFYSTQLGGNERPFADIGTTFTLELCCVSKEAEKLLKLAACAIWCWTHFGGLGSRARRGGGNLQVTEVKGEEEIPEGLSFTLLGIDTPEALRGHLERGLKKVRNLVATLNTLTPSEPEADSGFPILHPDFTDIWVIQSAWNSAFDAMEQVGRKFQQFRYKLGPDFPSVLNDYLNAGRSPSLERPAFGLPIQFRYRTAPDKQAMVKPESFTRRASPLILRFLKLGNGKIYLVFIHFKSAFLPKEERLQIKDQSRGPKQRPQLIDPPSPVVRQRLIQQLRDQFSGHLDVRKWL